MIQLDFFADPHVEEDRASPRNHGTIQPIEPPSREIPIRYSRVFQAACDGGRVWVGDSCPTARLQLAARIYLDQYEGPAPYLTRQEIERLVLAGLPVPVTKGRLL